MKKQHDTFKDKDILITGGLGFIGSNLAKRLVTLKANVTLVDSLIPAYGGNLFNVKGIEDKVKINISDIRDPYAMNYLVKDRDYIFNLAGQVSHIDSMIDAQTDLEINCRSQLVLLEACRSHNTKTKIVFASTRQVYGPVLHCPVTETHPLNPIDVNGVNKIAGEMYHSLFYKVYGIKTTCLRITNTFGPGQLMKHNRQGFIPWFIRQIIEGEEIKIFGDGLQERDMTYVDDVVDAFLMVATSEQTNGGIYNLGGERIALKDFVQLLVDVNGAGKWTMVDFPDQQKKIDIGSIYCDWSKIKTACQWEPRVSIKEGLRRTIEYYRQYRKHYWG